MLSPPIPESTIPIMGQSSAAKDGEWTRAILSPTSGCVRFSGGRLRGRIQSGRRVGLVPIDCKETGFPARSIGCPPTAAIQADAARSMRPQTTSAQSWVCSPRSKTIPRTRSPSGTLSGRKPAGSSRRWMQNHERPVSGHCQWKRSRWPQASPNDNAVRQTVRESQLLGEVTINSRGNTPSSIGAGRFAGGSVEFPGSAGSRWDRFGIGSSPIAIRMRRWLSGIPSQSRRLHQPPIQRCHSSPRSTFESYLS